MSYKDTLLTGRDLAAKIRAGQYQTRKPKISEEQNGLIPRKQKETAAERSEENFAQDMLLAYMMKFGPVAKAAANPSWYGDKDTSSVSLSSDDVDLGRVSVGLREAADELGVDPVDLATIVSYETAGTFNPTKKGPTTKWGQHEGLIQFGQPQAKEYGYDRNNPYDSQLGRGGAIVRYMRKNGVKPGMNLLDMYSTVNAGAPGLYDRSDTAAGGAPGTVRDKVEKQMGDHYKKALVLIHGSQPKTRPENT